LATKIYRLIIASILRSQKSSSYKEQTIFNGSALMISPSNNSKQRGSGPQKAPYAAHPLKIFVCAAVVISAFSHSAHADPVGIDDLLREPLSLAALLFTCLLSFALEYWILKYMLEGRFNATQSQFRKSFIKANAISFPIAWAICFGFGLLAPIAIIAGIAMAETFAIVSEKLLYNRWIGLSRAGKRGWHAVTAANLGSWIAGIVIGLIVSLFTHGLSEQITEKRMAANYQKCMENYPINLAGDLAWVNTNKIPYWHTSEGAIVQGSFSSDRTITLVASGVQGWPMVGVSPNGKYLIYSTKDEEEDFVLYDVVGNKSRGFPLNSAYRSKVIGFSRDSSLFSWYSSEKRAIIIADIETMNLRSFTWPDSQDKIDLYGDMRYPVDARWSADGKFIFFDMLPPHGNVVNFSTGKRDYYNLNLESAKFTKIEGHHWRVNGREFISFSKRGVRVQLPPCDHSQWDCTDDDPSAHREPVIDSQHFLIMPTADGKEVRTVNSYCGHKRWDFAKDPYWIEDGKYLIFAVNGKSYIYGVAEDKTALLSLPPVIVIGNNPAVSAR
jgi:hypothetical protein